MAKRPVRVQLEFENPLSLLSRYPEGPHRRCWFLVSPHLATVADLAADIVQHFNIDPHTCPHGITLRTSSIGFRSGQPFRIVRDNDVIGVSKKDGATRGMCVNEQLIVRNAKRKRSVQLLANEVQKRLNLVNDEEEKVPAEERNEINGTEANAE